MSTEHAKELTPTRQPGQVPPSKGSVRWRSFGFAGRALSHTGLGIPQGRGTLASMRRDARYRRLLGAADLSSVVIAAYTAITLLGQGDSLRLAAFAALPIVLVIGKAIGLYDRDESLLTKTTLEEAPKVFQVASIAALVIWLAGPAFVDGEIGRDQVLGLWGLLFGSMLFSRTAARRLARGSTAPERCLVVGDEYDRQRLSGKFAASHATAAIVVGRVAPPDETPTNGDAESVLGSTDALGLVLAEHEIDRVIIAPGAEGFEAILETIRVARSLGVKVSVLPRLFEVVGSSVEFENVEGTMLLGLRHEGLSRSSQALKRGMDVVGALAGLIVLAPLLAWIALTVKLTSPGPVLFRQKRIGRDGFEFEMIKFRTMVDGAEAQKEGLKAVSEADGLFKIADDPRLTRVGRALRRSSLDELPQLLNVLRGEMSLVGPRPLVPDEDRQIEGWGRRRLHVTPGMTGVWQLFGPARIPLHEMVKLDYVYGANWSVWLDLKILLRTIPHALGRRGL
jgi:exopolysaccharide biosynthesis polyprenyl glycosylphosphotransferase